MGKFFKVSPDHIYPHICVCVCVCPWWLDHFVWSLNLDRPLHITQLHSTETNKWHTNIENLQVTENSALLLVNFSTNRILWMLKNSPRFLIWMFQDFILVVLIALFKSTFTVISPTWKCLCTIIKWILIPLLNKPTKIKNMKIFWYYALFFF